MRRPFVIVDDMFTAAKELAEDEVLGCDPSDDNILIAAAELSGWPGDLAKLDRYWKDMIIAAWESSKP